MTKPRQQKTPKQRAEEQLGVANRKVARLESELHKHEKAAKDISRLLDQEVIRRDYLAQHPDLATPSTTRLIARPSTTTPTGDNT